MDEKTSTSKRTKLTIYIYMWINVNVTKRGFGEKPTGKGTCAAFDIR